MDCSLPGSSVHGIFQARVLEWVAISFSRRSSWPRDWTQVSCIIGKCSTIWAAREVLNKKEIYQRDVRELTKLGWKLEFSQGQEAGQKHKHQAPIDRFCSNHFLSLCSSQKTLNQGQKVWLAQLGSQAHTLIRGGRAPWWVVSTRRYLREQWLLPQTNWVLLLDPTSMSAEGKIPRMSHLFDDHSFKPSPLFPMYLCIPRQERDQPTQPSGGWMAKGMRWNGALENWAPCPERLPMCSPSPVV